MDDASLSKQLVSTLKKELTDNKVVGKAGKVLTEEQRQQKIERLRKHCSTLDEGKPKQKLLAFIGAQADKPLRLICVARIFYALCP